MAANNDTQSLLAASLQLGRVAGVTELTTKETVYQHKRLGDDPNVPMTPLRIAGIANSMGLTVQQVQQFEDNLVDRFPRFAPGANGRRPSPPKVKDTLSRVAGQRTIKVDSRHSKLMANAVAATMDLATYELVSAHNKAHEGRDYKMKRSDADSFAVQAAIRGLERPSKRRKRTFNGERERHPRSERR